MNVRFCWRSEPSFFFILKDSPAQVHWWALRQTCQSHPRNYPLPQSPPEMISIGWTVASRDGFSGLWLRLTKGSLVALLLSLLACMGKAARAHVRPNLSPVAPSGRCVPDRSICGQGCKNSCL